MGLRTELQTQLEDLLGTRNVYFQPPPSVDLVYPCIMYEIDAVNSDHADNNPYRREKRYKVTVIDRNPDSAIPDNVGALPMCSFNRFFTTDGLNHHVFQLFF